MQWRHQALPAEQIDSLSRRLRTSQTLAELLLRLDLEDPDVADAFLRPRLASIEDPFRLTCLEAAATRLQQAVERGESVAVFGDYDVDGVTSTALLVGALRRFGLNPSFVVPRRLEEGYGLSLAAIERALEKGSPDLFVALDCGTNSVTEVASLRARGIDVIIVDHHRSKESRPIDCILVNPHAYEEDQGRCARFLCTVGLVFKLVHGLLRKLREAGDERCESFRLRDYLDLVAMGTVADLVPLVDENRIFAKHGLRILQQTERVGLRSLMEVSGMRRGEEVQPVDVSFRLGPRINASGRLADAAVSVELILGEDPAACLEAALKLDGFNRERQEIERQITEDAFRQVEEQQRDARAIVLYGEEWHPGVVGIVASRVSRKFHRPCVVLGREGDLAKGSGRSVDGVSLVDALGRCSDLLANWGGHPMAVGVALPPGNLPAFRVAFDQAVAALQADCLVERCLEIAAWLPLEAISEELLEEICQLHPFGQGNPEPVFASRGICLAQPPEIFKEQHFRFQVRGAGGRRLYGVAWKMANSLPPVGQLIDIAYQLVWNNFNGRRLLQLELADWRLSES
jgi:single-stranded-DNA-specific exonuclease